MMRSEYGPDNRFPDFVLRDHTQTERTLSALQGDDPMLVVLIRGLFCPKDREQLKALTRFHPQLVVGSCRLVVITTDDWHTADSQRQQLGAHYPFLCDEEQQVRDRLDVESADGEQRSMIPHTFLLAPGLKIRKVWRGYYSWGRPSTCELHDALREVTREIHPDLDGQDPRRLDRWDAGDGGALYPGANRPTEQALSAARQQRGSMS